MGDPGGDMDVLSVLDLPVYHCVVLRVPVCPVSLFQSWMVKMERLFNEMC